MNAFSVELLVLAFDVDEKFVLVVDLFTDFSDGFHEKNFLKLAFLFKVQILNCLLFEFGKEFDHLGLALLALVLQMLDFLVHMRLLQFRFGLVVMNLLVLIK